MDKSTVRIITGRTAPGPMSEPVITWEPPRPVRGIPVSSGNGLEGGEPRLEHHILQWKMDGQRLLIHRDGDWFNRHRKCVNSWKGRIKPSQFIMIEKTFEILEEVLKHRVQWLDCEAMIRRKDRPLTGCVVLLDFRVRAPAEFYPTWADRIGAIKTAGRWGRMRFAQIAGIHLSRGTAYSPGRLYSVPSLWYDVKMKIANETAEWLPICRSAGLGGEIEGVVGKPVNSTYEASITSKNWTKHLFDPGLKKGS